jgi:hypothetical protein
MCVARPYSSDSNKGRLQTTTSGLPGGSDQLKMQPTRDLALVSRKVRLRKGDSFAVSATCIVGLARRPSAKLYTEDAADFGQIDG